MEGTAEAERAMDAGAENTLDAENTIRIHYLRDRILDVYWVNRRTQQGNPQGRAERAELSHASPGATLRLMAYARYMFLEIWQSWLLEDTVEATVTKRGMGDYSTLGGLIEQDPETKALVERMRHRFGAHHVITLDEAMEDMRSTGFPKFLRCAQKILMFKDAARTVTYVPGSLDAVMGRGTRMPASAQKALSEAERQKLKRRYAAPMHRGKRGEDVLVRGMQECAMCLKILLKGMEVATSLHRQYRTQETMALLVHSTYDLKYVILEAHGFTEGYRGLGLPDGPGFLARAKKYKLYRNQYSAHNDKRVPSIMRILGDSAFSDEMVRDAEEIIVLSGQLFPDLDVRETIELPTGAQIAEMETEMELHRVKSHEPFGNKFLGGEYDKKCREARERMAAENGLN